MIGKIPVLRVLAAILAVSPFSTTAAAQSYKVESAAAPAPQELAASVRGEMSDHALRVSDAKGPYCEIWLRKSLPSAATPDKGLGVVFSQINEGSLVGAIRFDNRVGDFRGQPVQPGVYTLRYMLIPVDGNHQGVAPNRDFLLLVPSSLDSSPPDIATKDLLDRSRKASGTGHPAVWSLMPGDAAPQTLPAIVHQGDGDLWILYFPVPLAKPAPMGLVVAGHAPEQ